MDAEGLGRELLLNPPRPSENPEKQTVGTVTASHNILTLQALSSSLSLSMLALQRGGGLSPRRLFSYLRQSVPQNGRVHLLGIELGKGWGGVEEGVGAELGKGWGGLGFLYFKNPI